MRRVLQTSDCKWKDALGAPTLKPFLQARADVYACQEANEVAGLQKNWEVSASFAPTVGQTAVSCEPVPVVSRVNTVG
jgi:hypothetical protein